MPQRAYDAILLDLDGTLVDERDRIHPHTFEALQTAAVQGVRVMIATGRSELATIPVLDRLGFDTPAIVYNGAGVWCPAQRRMLEERVLSERTLGRALDFGERFGHMTVTMCVGIKYATKPRSSPEQAALHDMTGLVVADRETMLARRAIRATLFSDRHATSDQFAAELEEVIAGPVYITHFPLNALPHHRESKLLVCDVQPPCKGKAEGLRVLRELYGIDAARTVAVGDASNDLPMFEAAGLAVAMQDSMPDALAAADRVIGANGTGTIGDLVRELFLV